MHRIVRRFAACLLAVSCSFTVSACNGQIAGVLTETTRNLLESKKPANLGGMAISVFSDRGVVWRYDSDASIIPFRHDDGIQIGQLSKQCTILAVLVAAQKYGIDLDAPIRRYLPELFPADQSIDGPPGIGDQKIRDMMLETTGFIDRPPQAAGNIDLALRLESAKRAFPQGIVRTESSLTFELLGLLVERLSGMSFDAFVTSFVFRPLGMNSSTFNFDDSIAVCRFYNASGTEYEESSAHLYARLDPSFSMRSTPRDLERLYIAILRAWSASGYSRLPPHAADLFFKSSIERQLERQNMKTGAVWILDPAELSHSGRTAYAEGSYLSHNIVVILLKDQHTGIMLTSSIFDGLGTSRLREIGTVLAKSYMADKHGITAPVFNEPPTRKIPPPYLQVSGLYASEQGIATIDAADDTLDVQMNGSFAKFVYDDLAIFLPRSREPFSKLEAVDASTCVLYWNSGLTTTLKRQDAIPYDLSHPLKARSYVAHPSEPGGLARAFSIFVRAGCYTVLDDSGKEYLLLNPAKEVLSAFCNGGSWLFYHDLLLQPDGTVNLTPKHD